MNQDIIAAQYPLLIVDNIDLNPGIQKFEDVDNPTGDVPANDPSHTLVFDSGSPFFSFHNWLYIK